MSLNAREVTAILAIVVGVGIAAIATERRQSLTLPAFGKPVCPVVQSPQSPVAWPHRPWWDV